jgi:hypothetical protein
MHGLAVKCRTAIKVLSSTLISQQTHDVTPTSGIRRLNVTSGNNVVVTTLCSRNFTTLYHDVYITLQNYVYTT